MATTNTVQTSVYFAQCFLGFKQLNIGTSLQPAVTAANIVLETIIGNPFVWNWNRSVLAYALPTNFQDVAVSTNATPSTAAATFGFIEKGGYVPAVAVTATASTSTVVTYTAANTFTAGNPVTIVGTTNASGIFNLINATIASASGTQFTVNLANAGFGSQAETGYAGSGVTAEITNIADVLGTGTETGAPNFLAAQTDNNAGTITFRALPAADQNYIIFVTFQKRIPALITTLSGTWAPIPDHFSYIYENGFTAWMLAYALDPRWQNFNQKFVASLLAAAEGVSDEDKNQFMTMWGEHMNTAASMGARRQQGVQGIGSL